MAETFSSVFAHSRTIGEISGLVFVLGILALYGLAFAFVRRPWQGWFILFFGAMTTALLLVAGSCDVRRQCAEREVAYRSTAGEAGMPRHSAGAAVPDRSERRR